MSELLDAIKQAIEASPETRYRISKGSGVSQAQLSRLMAGAQGMSLDNVERLAKYLGLTIIVKPARGKDR